jgi:molybdopterin/thiamine biosynthesis adenylyltransferase
MPFRRSRDDRAPRASKPRTWYLPGCPPDADPIDIEMAFTPAASRTLLATVGSRTPESGAKLFGPVERFGVDRVEFDVLGSERASGAVYSPDTRWGSERLRYWISQRGGEQRIWTGDAHSHPSAFGWPSAKAGPGLGDLGYVEAVFEENEVQNEFCIPILTNVGQRPADGPVRIHPWLVLRSEPLRPRWGSFVIRSVDEFEPRRFNPAFDSGEDLEEEPVSDLPPGVDLNRLATLLVRQFGRHILILDHRADGTIEIDTGDLIVELRSDAAAVSVAAIGASGHAGTFGEFPEPRLPAEEDLERRAAALVEIAVDAVDAAGSSVIPNRRPPADPPADPLGDPLGEHLPAATPRIPASPLTPEEYYARTEGVLSPGFHERSILVVGASGGSHLIEMLARLGPRRLVVVDPDIVEVPNLVRTAFRLDQVGRSKPDAIAELVAAANPFVDVVPVAEDVTRLTSEEVAALLDDVDVIVAGTDRFDAQAALNRWSQIAQIPAVFIGIHRGAAGGIVRWSVPSKTACYRCVARERYAAARAGESIDLDGEPGLIIDVQAVDMVAASVIVGLLERGAPTAKGQLIEQLGDRTEIVVSTSPGYEWGAMLFSALTSDVPPPTSRDADLATYLGALPVITLPSAADPECPDCALGRSVTRGGR